MAPATVYLEAPRRLRSFVRAYEFSLVVLAALVGTVGGLVVAAMSAAVEGLRVLLFNLEMGERLSSQFSIEPWRALLVPSLGGLLLGVAFLVLAKRDTPNLPAGSRPRWDVHSICAAPISASWSDAAPPSRSRAPSVRRWPAPSPPSSL